jgi:hypothetical protein
MEEEVDGNAEDEPVAAHMAKVVEENLGRHDMCTHMGPSVNLVILQKTT